MFREEEVIQLSNDNGLELSPDEKIYMRSKLVTLLHEPEYPKLEKQGEGVLFLTDRRLLFDNKQNGEVLSYPFEVIRGRSTERNSIFQIILEDDIARFIMPEESVYKWGVLYDFIRRRGGYRDEEY